MGPISNINVPKNKVKNLNSCSLFSKSCCVSLLQEDAHRSHRAHNTVDQIFKHALLLALTSTLITLTLCQRGSHHSDSASPAVVCGNSLHRQEAVCVYFCAYVFACVCLTSACSLWQVHPPTPSHIAEVGVLSALSLKLDTWGTLTEISTRQELLS